MRSEQRSTTAFGFTPIWINRSGAPDEYLDLAPRAVLRSLAEI